MYERDHCNSCFTSFATPQQSDNPSAAATDVVAQCIYACTHATWDVALPDLLRSLPDHNLLHIETLTEFALPGSPGMQNHSIS